MQTGPYSLARDRDAGSNFFGRFFDTSYENTGTLNYCLSGGKQTTAIFFYLSLNIVLPFYIRSFLAQFFIKLTI